mgnify:CR=1 FL=1
MNQSDDFIALINQARKKVKFKTALGASSTYFKITTSFNGHEKAPLTDLDIERLKELSNDLINIGVKLKKLLP